MQRNAFTSYLRPAGQVCADGSEPYNGQCPPADAGDIDPRVDADGYCPDGGLPGLGARGCGIDNRSAANRAAQTETARRDQDFRLAGQLATAIAHLGETIVTGVLTADVQNTAARYRSETAIAVRNLSEQANSSDPTTRSAANRAMQDLQDRFDALSERMARGGASGSSSSKTLTTVALVLGGVAVLGGAAYLLTRKPARKNPMVGHGRNRHFISAKHKRAQAKHKR